MTGTGLDNIRACLLLEQHAFCISEQMDQLLGALRDQLRGALREDSTFSLTARGVCCRALMRKCLAAATSLAASVPTGVPRATCLGVLILATKSYIDSDEKLVGAYSVVVCPVRGCRCCPLPLCPLA